MQAEEFRALVKGVVEDGRTLSRVEASAVLAMLLGSTPGATGLRAGIAPDPLVNRSDELPAVLALPLAALLAAMAQRGETAEELCGFAEAIRAAATLIPLTGNERARLVDTCGTGGDALDTLNISTAAGLVAAGAGAMVAKHGNRAVTSRCGSADVLDALGVPVALAPADAAECLRVTGFVFMLATGLHPAMRRVAPVRRAMRFRTIFNLAGPLANPAGAAAQVIGVYAENRMPVVAEALRLLGVRHAWVVHGRVEGAAHGLDELTVTGASAYMSVQNDRMKGGLLEPASVGLQRAPVEALRGGATAQESAAILEAVLLGQDRSARRDVVLLNAAAALLVSGLAATIEEGLARAGAAVKSGDAMRVLERLRAFRPNASSRKV